MSSSPTTSRRTLWPLINSLALVLALGLGYGLFTWWGRLPAFPPPVLADDWTPGCDMRAGEWQAVTTDHRTFTVGEAAIALVDNDRFHFVHFEVTAPHVVGGSWTNKVECGDTGSPLAPKVTFNNRIIAFTDVDTVRWFLIDADTEFAVVAIDRASCTELQRVLLPDSLLQFDEPAHLLTHTIEPIECINLGDGTLAILLTRHSATADGMRVSMVHFNIAARSFDPPRTLTWGDDHPEVETLPGKRVLLTKRGYVMGNRSHFDLRNGDELPLPPDLAFVWANDVLFSSWQERRSPVARGWAAVPIADEPHQCSIWLEPEESLPAALDPAANPINEFRYRSWLRGLDDLDIAALPNRAVHIDGVVLRRAAPGEHDVVLSDDVAIAERASDHRKRVAPLPPTASSLTAPPTLTLPDPPPPLTTRIKRPVTGTPALHTQLLGDMASNRWYLIQEVYSSPAALNGGHGIVRIGSINTADGQLTWLGWAPSPGVIPSANPVTYELYAGKSHWWLVAQQEVGGGDRQAFWCEWPALVDDTLPQRFFEPEVT
ncbi:MAG: hypothetical protein ABI743_04390, partial [bacterium]